MPKTRLLNIKEQLSDSAKVKREMYSSCAKDIIRAVDIIMQALSEGGKVMFCGNGGSAADSQHLATEMVSKLNLERRAIPAVALTTDTSLLTAVANDYNFSDVFARQVEAIGNAGDVLVAISTSGNSENVLKALTSAAAQGIKTVTMTGRAGGKMKDSGDVRIAIPSDDTQRIQEGHITAGHLICDLVERELFG